MSQMWLKMLEKYALDQWRTRYSIKDADLWESSNMRKKTFRKKSDVKGTFKDLPGSTNSSFMSKRN